MSKKIIAIVGKKGSGKDTIGNIIKELDPEFQQYSFAMPIKKVITDVFGIPNSQLEGRKEKETPIERWYNKSPRDLMKDVGDAFKEKINKNIWIDILFDTIKDKEKVVITDLRFKNEYDKCREKGVFIIKVVRPEINSSDTHISETDLDSICDSKYDAYILNSGTIEDLKPTIEKILKYGKFTV